MAVAAVTDGGQLVNGRPSVDPSVDALFSAALALHREARVEEAAAGYRQVLESQPVHIPALMFLGTIALDAHDVEEALVRADQVLKIDPQQVGAHFIRAQALTRIQRWDEACASYATATGLKPDFADAHFSYGLALEQLGRHREAVVSYERVIALAPTLREPHFNRGLALHRLEVYDAALASFDRALGLDPCYAEAHYARGNLLKDMRQFEAALASYDCAIDARPAHAEAYVNRGNVLAELERSDAALASYDSAIRLDPCFANAWCNRGSLLSDLGRHDEALESLNRAIYVDPRHAQAYFTRGLVHLSRGDLLPGWRDFEWRWESEHCVTSQEKRRYAQPQWSGHEDLEGKTLFVHCEQGLGDTLQFCRYLPLVALRGARVIAEVPPELRGILGRMEGVAQWLVRGEPAPSFDYYCPLLSLPLAFGTALDSVPVPIPYLRPRAERIAHWREIVGARNRLRVGLVWSGGFRPDQPGLWSVNRRRNIPLAQLAPLKHPDIEFFSLQKGQPAETELAAAIAGPWMGPTLVDHTRALTDFEETAALIEQLDLVISVDTSTAHLAGALGKPVWLLNRFDTCWRWLWDRDDSPWYPSLKVYRQRRFGDWDDVVRRVRIDLDGIIRRS